MRLPGTHGVATVRIAMIRVLAASAVALLLNPRRAAACEWCRDAVDAAIFGDDFWMNFAFAVLPFAVIALVVIAVEISGTRPAPAGERPDSTANPPT